MGVRLPISCGVLLLLLCFHNAQGDIYLSSPRGSNNRLNERSANRNNANRLFDSQNNNRGGYNVGDSTAQPAGTNQEKQYRMKHFQSGPWKSQTDGSGRSLLTVEWTNQHGCGANKDFTSQKQNCGLVLQYMCQDEKDTAAGDYDSFRDGESTQRSIFRKPSRRNADRIANRKDNDVDPDTGLQESWDWYNACYLRERNKGLFTADQKLAKNKLRVSSAIYTRQNPTGNQYGYECPEERDYFPYWHPTPWVDIAVLAENASLCSHYQGKSFNTQPYNACIDSKKGWSQHTTEADCVKGGGKWMLLHSYLEKAPSKNDQQSCESTKTSGLTHKWAVAHDSTDYQPECLVALDKPECVEAPWSRDNHHGNGINGEPLRYTWTLPHFPSGQEKRCVFRIRYNITTDDYDPFNTDHRHNQDFPAVSPVQNNPLVYVVDDMSPLRLAINTAQYGRTFQDRSHVFVLKPRPLNNLEDKATIHNLNVRGKRGNIVQVYPAVEYDFIPNGLTIKQGEMVHIQWTGSNTHNNGNPAGDGQAGAAGEGKAGTDRHNLVQMDARGVNFPTPFEQTTMWNDVDVMWIYHKNTTLDKKDLAINMASSGYYRCASKNTCGAEAADGKKAALNNKLNNAPASYEGAVLRFNKKGTYHFMCTRNNNFSNRSQKASIIVV